MSKQDKIKHDIKIIADDSKDIERDILAYVRREFDAMLEKTGVAAKDVNVSARDMLGGVEKGLKKAGHKSSDIIVKVAGILVEETQTITSKSVETARAQAASAKVALGKALEDSKDNIDSLEERTKVEMKVAHSELYKKTHDMLGKMEAVAQAVYDYSSDEAQEIREKVGPKLKDVSNKAINATKETEHAAAVYSETLLLHSQEKTASWLRKLAIFVEPN